MQMRKMNRSRGIENLFYTCSNLDIANFLNYDFCQAKPYPMVRCEGRVDMDLFFAEDDSLYFED